MRRIRRLFFTVICAGSMFIGLATAGLWSQSVSSEVFLSHSRWVNHGSQATERGWMVVSGDGWIYLAHSRAEYLTPHIVQLLYPHYREWNYFTESTVVPGLGLQESFRLGEFTHTSPDLTTTEWGVELPAWALMAVTAILPLAWLVNGAKRRWAARAAAVKGAASKAAAAPPTVPHWPAAKPPPATGAAGRAIAPTPMGAPPVGTPRFCPKCGAGLPGNVDRCANCGKVIRA
jgi:hypothetical protein